MKCNRGTNNNLKRIFCNLAFKNNKYKKGIIIILGLVFINCCDYKFTDSTLEANKEENELTENNGDEIELVNVESINNEENEKKEDQASEIIENEGMFSNTINDSFLKEERCSYCQSCLKKKIVFCGKEFSCCCLACLLSSLGAITAGLITYFLCKKKSLGNSNKVEREEEEEEEEIEKEEEKGIERDEEKEVEREKEKEVEKEIEKEVEKEVEKELEKEDPEQKRYAKEQECFYSSFPGEDLATIVQKLQEKGLEIYKDYSFCKNTDSDFYIFQINKIEEFNDINTSKENSFVLNNVSKNLKREVISDPEHYKELLYLSAEKDYINTLKEKDLSETEIKSILLKDFFLNLSEREEHFISVKNPEKFFSNFDSNLMNNIFNIKCIQVGKEKLYSIENFFKGYENVKSIDISLLDLSEIKSANSCFYGCKNLVDLKLPSCNFSKCEDLSYFFAGCSNLKNINCENWTLFSIVSMTHLFDNCKNLISITLPQTGDKLKDISYMFANCENLNTVISLNSFNTINIENMSHLFYNCFNLQSIDSIKNWNTKNLINVEYLFFNCKTLSSINLNWNTKNIINANFLFSGCYNLLNIIFEGLNLDITVPCTNMFRGCTNIEKVCTPENLIIENSLQSLWSQKVIYLDKCYFKKSDFVCPNSDIKTELDNKLKNLGLIEDEDYFWYDKSGDLDFSVMTFNDKENTNSCFFSCKNLFINGESIFKSLLKLESINIKQQSKNKINTAESMFEDCRNLVSVNLEGLDFQNAISVKAMFKNCNSLETLFLGKFNTLNVITFESMFENCSSINNLDFSKIITSESESFKNMFNGCKNLTSINLSLFNTEKATNMSGMFDFCESITSLDLSRFNTPKLKDIGSMFKDCIKLEQIRWNNNFITSNVTNMIYLFYNCKSLKYIDLSFFDTKNVEVFGGMFTNCASLTNLDLTSFNTSNGKNMSFMFYGCTYLTTLKLTSFDVKKVTTMAYMFAGCSFLSDLQFWQNTTTENLTDIQSLFFGCMSLIKIDLSSFITTKVTNMDSAFYYCTRLLSLNLNNFDSTSLVSANNMFAECWSLKEIYANNKFSPGSFVSTNNMFFKSFALVKVCMILNEKMLDNLEENIGKTSISLGCYIKNTNTLSTNNFASYEKQNIFSVEDTKKNLSSLFNIDLRNETDFPILNGLK